MTAPAPAPSAEARRLIEAAAVAARTRENASAVFALCDYVAGLEAEVERLRHLVDAGGALSHLAGRTALVAVAPDARWSTLSFGPPDRQGRPASVHTGPLPANDFRALLVRALSSVDSGAAAALRSLPADPFVSPSVPDEIKVRRFSLGDRVRKLRGSSWHGRVVGFYSTSLTPVGYCVESEREPGSVQIYPEAAMEVWDGE